jgi:hypothetical protein
MDSLLATDSFIPDLERLIAEAMDEWKIPGLAMTVVQNGEVALVGAYGLRDVSNCSSQSNHRIPAGSSGDNGPHRSVLLTASLAADLFRRHGRLPSRPRPGQKDRRKPSATYCRSCNLMLDSRRRHPSTMT